jgi:beta-lactamase class C
MKTRPRILAAAVLFLICGIPSAGRAADGTQSAMQRLVDTAIQPVMASYGIPGMAVGVTVAGKPYVFTYGVASIKTRQPITRDTLFEIGSVSKTFTATLASYAQVTGHLSLSDKTSEYLPVLRGSKFGNVRLLNLGTHTPGGLPLQVPSNIQNNEELMQYLKKWRPAHEPGTYRTYSNVGIGTLGLITAKSVGQDFVSLVDDRLFPMLGMKNSYVSIPNAHRVDYAQGYTSQGAPIRVAPGVLATEAYGIKATAPDMIRFVEANMGSIGLDKQIQRAIMQTHTGYFKVGPMTQDLIWEQYPYPVALESLLEGNSSAMSLHANPATEIQPPEEPSRNVWINKTGSTNGFTAYVAFIPEKQLGIVILTNKNIPADARVSAAYKILTTLADGDVDTRK